MATHRKPRAYDDNYSNENPVSVAMRMMMTATKETTLATSFIVILTVITTMTMNDEVVQGRSVITESSLTLGSEAVL